MCVEAWFCQIQSHMYILLKHANHKELLTSINNGVKTLEIAVTASRWETRCCINISCYRYHGIQIYTKRYTYLGESATVRGFALHYKIFSKFVYLLVYISNTMISVV